jgi:hypothetical protein
MGITQENIGVTHPMVAFTFSQTDVAANQDGTTVKVNADGDEYVMPWAGHAVAISALANTAVTAETLIFKAAINGTEDADLTVQLDTTNTLHHETKIDAINVPFVAGDRLGCVYDTHADYTPTTLDAVVVIFVVFNDVRY